MRVLLLAALAACQGSGREEAPGARLDPAGPHPLTGARLVDPGREPRQHLAYRFDPSHRDEIRISNLSIDTVQSTGREPRTFPSNVLAFDLAITSESKRGGAARVHVEVVAVESTDESRAASVRADAAPLIGGWFELVMGAHGVEGPITWMGQPLSGKSELLRADLESKLPVLFVPLPEVDLGAGARWERVIERSALGATNTETYRYSLDEVAGGALAISVVVDSKAAGSVTATSLARGALRASHATWRPALATLIRRGELSFADGGATVHVQQKGALEVTAAGQKPIAIRATCADLERCCAAAASLMAPDQVAECTAAVRGGDPAACSQKRTDLLRAFLVAGAELPYGCAEMR
jgi:hypothetical protein